MSTPITDNLSRPYCRGMPELADRQSEQGKTASPPIESDQPRALLSSSGSPFAWDVIKAAFFAVYSNMPVPLKGCSFRDDFIKAVERKEWNVKPVVVSQSAFVPQQMVAHLIRNKKESALGVKYERGDKITNMEGALHTFITSLCPITISGDYIFRGRHDIIPLPNGMGRNVILSTAIQPDFELRDESEVVMKIVEIKDAPVEGEDLPPDFQPLWSRVSRNQQEFDQQRPGYERQLQRGMVYHLTAKHRLPGLQELDPNRIFERNEALQQLESLILDSDKSVDLSQALCNRFVRLKGHVISFEALFNIYVCQLCNEFSVLETFLPQGYVYTMDPPSIFAHEIGGVNNVEVLNRFQILAFKKLQQHFSFSNLKILGFNDYADRGAISLLGKIFPDKRVLSKQELFTGGHYSVEEGAALVLHNNSDAFGHNIASEGPKSMDGVIGTYSDAACHLDLQRADLLDYIYTSLALTPRAPASSL